MTGRDADYGLATAPSAPGSMAGSDLAGRFGAHVQAPMIGAGAT
ncbi:hypothetical protein [Paracoccus salsus]|nr:hypothetical protein [Paracoccus salsus]